jgi:hypothetical protein
MIHTLILCCLLNQVCTDALNPVNPIHIQGFIKHNRMHLILLHSAVRCVKMLCCSSGKNVRKRWGMMNKVFVSFIIMQNLEGFQFG